VKTASDCPFEKRKPARNPKRHFTARAARRRHRCVRLSQHRAASRPCRPTSEWRKGVDQSVRSPTTCSATWLAPSRGGVQFLASHCRQRGRGHVWRQKVENTVQGGGAGLARERDQGRRDRERHEGHPGGGPIWEIFRSLGQPAIRITPFTHPPPDATASTPATWRPSSKRPSEGWPSPKSTRAKKHTST